jgi:hypothetical protein
VNEEIDAAYHANYDRYSARYVDPTVAPEARAATIRLVPR